jgi:hypothetical protein
MKQHAIIEKTALFISQQGGQMEVLLKAKQSGNSQFGFLSYDNELHAYYKLVLNAIRSNRYKVMTEDKEESEEEDSDGDNYLHPSLAGSTIVDAVRNNLGAQKCQILTVLFYVSGTFDSQYILPSQCRLCLLDACQQDQRQTHRTGKEISRS